MTLVIPQHPENPSRLLCIWRRFLESGIAERCVRVARRAALEEIQCCHAETHALVYGTDMVNRCTLTGSQELNRDNRSAVKWNNSIESYSNQNENDTLSFFLQNRQILSPRVRRSRSGRRHLLERAGDPSRRQNRCRHRY